MRAHWLKALLPAVIAVLLTACGGSGGSDEGTAEAQGEVEVAVTAEPDPGYQHAWVTVEALWFHKGSVQNPEDIGWLKYNLDEPVTVDLMAVSTGNLADAFEGLQLPVGTYQQMRVFLVDSDQALTSSATAAGLQYNSQLDLVAENGSTLHAPLELVAPNDGVVVVGTFKVEEDQTLSLALNFNIERDVKEFAYEETTHYLLSPVLSYYNLAHVGAIVGQIDPADLSTAEEGDGGYNVVISAQRPDDDGFRQIERYTTVKSDGSFALFPLFIKDDGSSTDYDVVIRGRGFDTVIVRGVTAKAGTGPESGQNPTVLQASALSLTPSAEYLADLVSRANPSSQLLRFYQTVAGVDAPYLMHQRATDPFSGQFFADLPLSGGPLHVGSYNQGQDLVFTAVSPEEGLGAYQPIAYAPLYVSAPAEALVQPVASGQVEAIQVPALTPESPAIATSISGTLTLATPGKYDSGYLVVARYGVIVTTIALDEVLAQNGGSGGSFTVGNVPGGASNDSFQGGIYRLYARLWNSSDPEGTLVRRPVGGFVDLRAGSVSNLALTVN